MSSTGIDVFDKTLQLTHTWLDEIMATHGPDHAGQARKAWEALPAEVRALWPEATASA